MNINENMLEKSVIEIFGTIGYSHLSGADISPGGNNELREAYDQVVLFPILEDALNTLNPGFSYENIQEALKAIEVSNKTTLIDNNREFSSYLIEGFPVEVEVEGDFITKRIKYIDFQNHDNNTFNIVDQFTIIENGNNKRPDLIAYINGIPVSVIELKNPVNEETTIEDGYKQIKTYQSTIESLFYYNSFNVISDGINTKVGTVTSNYDRYMSWRTIDGVTLSKTSDLSIETLVLGMYSKERILDIISNFIIFVDNGTDVFKILSAYHQYHAVNKALYKTIESVSSHKNQIGVIWHTQGSGKSYTMTFYAAKMMKSNKLLNPTIIVITDRNDLDDQLYTTFFNAKSILRTTPERASSREELKQLINNRNSGGVIFTTIQKFEETSINLSDRSNIIVMVDEAHRSQYGFSAEYVEKDDSIKYGYAKHLRDALPNASYIGFTGTPIALEGKNTVGVFGDYIDTYDMTQAVDDGATVTIFYESRIAKLTLDDSAKALIDDEYDEITENQEETQKESMKSKWSRVEAIVGTKERIDLIANDIVMHYENRQSNQTYKGGKAMVVAMSRRICVDLYDAIVKLRPEWHSDELNSGKIKVVMTGSSSDPLEWQKHVGNKNDRDKLALRMKDDKDELQIVIVRDMWLTGFDVPSMNTMYIDKPMQGHNLMQAIARVNRVFKDKQGGLIVDYIGIADSLKKALNQYTDSDKSKTGIDSEQAVDLLIDNLQICQEIIHPFDYSNYFSDNGLSKIKTIVGACDYILSLGKERKKDYKDNVLKLTKSFSLCSTTKKAQDYNDEISFHKAVRSAIIKLELVEKPHSKSKTELDEEINQLISKSISANEVIDVFKTIGLDTPNLAILSDDFLEEVRNMEQKNVAIELLKRLLKGKIKSIAKSNIIESKKFSDMLENAMSKYNSQSIQTTEIIMQLIEMAKEINESSHRGEELGLSNDELAFYDVLSQNESAKLKMSDDTLKKIAQELANSIKNSKAIDWNIREDVQAKMRSTVKRLLKKYGYPPEISSSAVEMVMEQTHLMADELF
jgi:type I restriction enzyme R subunit